MRNYESSCLWCNSVTQAYFGAAPYPEYEKTFLYPCKICRMRTPHTRILTKKTKSELWQKHEEQDLRESIVNACKAHGFSCRFLYQSVIITTNLSDWAFDYHQSKITLFHESTVKINFKTGNYAKSHVQFRGRKMTPVEVISYIAAHDAWKAQQS